MAKKGNEKPRITSEWEMKQNTQNMMNIKAVCCAQGQKG